MNASTKHGTRRVVLYLVVVAVLIGSSVQPIAASSLAQGPTEPGTSDRATDPAVQISGPQVDAALERAPDPDKALVVDQANPQWRTVYGTEAGRQLLPPRQSEIPAQVEGAVPPLSGFWITRTIQSGTNGITAIAYAPDGRLFAGLNSAGLRVYGPNGSGIYGWTSITASPGGLPSNNVSSLAIFNGDLWVGTGGSGVGVYDLNSGTWISYTVANSPLPNDTINRLTPVINPNGPDYIWISTNGGGAAKFTPGRPNTWNIINTVDGLPSNIVFDVAVDINGSTTTTWFAHFGGLDSWDGSTFTSQGGGNCAPWNYANRVIVDRLHRVWYVPVQIIPGRPSTPNTVVEEPIGVCLRTVGAPLPLVFYTLFNTTSPGLPSNYVSDLSEDYAGRIWMGMLPSFFQNSGGGAVYDNGTWKLYTVSSSPIVTNSVRSVLAVGEAVWWGHGNLNTFSVHSPNWLRYSNVPSGETPQAIFLETTRTWIGGTSNIAYTNGGAFTSINIPGNTASVSSFARDGNGALWVGTSGNGVYKYAGGNFTPYTTTSGLPNNGVNALLSDHLGRIWAGTNGGLALRAEAGYWLTFTTSTSPIAGNLVQALARDSSDRLWIGTTNGVSVYDLNGVGNPAWISYTTANGLPSDIVTGLTADSAGNMWASTYGGGVASFNPISNTWTTYSSTLPSTQALDVASDPSGRIWTTTAGGLALRQGSTWRSFRVPESALDSHRLADVASDNDRTWVQGNSSIAVRGVITSPIGNFVPSISSFSPISATPGMTIIIHGNHFDDRGPEFNVVKFPDMNHFPTIQAEVISVTVTSIAVKVPALASSGSLQVEANGLKSPLSAVDFQLMPKITNISPTCLSAGSELKISGLGFMDGSAAAYVKIGSGAERTADATDPTQIRTFIRPGDTNGQVRVRLLNGNQVIASQSVSIATIQVNQTKVQQAVEGERLIWGKSTLVQLGATSAGCNGAMITRATLNWKFNTGLTVNGAILNFAGGKALPASLPSFSLDNAVSMVGDLDISSVADSLNLPSNPYISSLTFFTGVDVILRNNNVDVLTVNIPKSKFNFIDTANVQRHFTLMMVTGNTAAKQSADFDTNMFENMAAMSRLYPQQDGYWYGGRYAWIWDTPIWISTDVKINFDPTNDNTDLARDPVDDYLDPGGDRWAIAFLDPADRNTSNTYIGMGGNGARTVVATNDPGVGGKTAIHELMHAFGFVDSDAPNYQPSDVPGEDHHSKYNEGKWSDFADCKSNRTYRQALSDFTGNGNNRVVRLFTGSTAPAELRTSACSTAAGSDQGNTAKSIISYAPSRNDYNTVLEPIDWRMAIDQLCEDGGCSGYNGPLVSSKSINRIAPTTEQAATRTLRLNGVIDSGNVITPSVSYVAVDDGEVTAQDPAGQYHLVVRDAGQAVLHDQKFAVVFDETAPHPDVQGSLRAHEGDAPSNAAQDVAFNLRVPFPDTAASAEIVYSGTVLWSKTVSAHAPTVNLTTPNGGTFSAVNPMTATWTASDADSDPLQFALEYSADDGVTWTLIAPKVIGNSWSWTPNFSTASTTARVRVRASDGFNTAYATSAAFTLTPRAPEAIILSPSAGAVFAEGDTLDLSGFSLTSNGPNLGAFTWKLNDVTVGNTRTISTPLTAIGVNTITLQVAANALSDSRTITVTVIPDYDHDGLPNAWELQHQLNPLDPTDAMGDADGDTLSNADEYRLGTDPRSSDTDGDGFNDNVEVDAGTDPLNPASVPNPNPILNVGSVSMGFTINDYSPLPGPKSTWVTNSGGGTLNFNVTKDAAWLNVSATSGTAPQKLSVSANHSGLAIGTYQGHVTVSAPGASDSPQAITVTLTINSIPNYAMYLPLIQR